MQMMREKLDAVNTSYLTLMRQHTVFLEIEVSLGGRPLRESLMLLAEVFANKYPQEDAEVVQNLLHMFTAPMEEVLRGKDTEPEELEPGG